MVTLKSGEYKWP